MKKLVIVLVIFLCSFKALSQEQYVEVVVTDTILVEPQEWTLYINFMDNYRVFPDTVTTMVDTVYANPSMRDGYMQNSSIIMEQIKAIVKKHGGRLEEDKFNSTARHRPYQQEALLASFTTRQAMEALIKELKVYTDVSVSIMNGTHKNLKTFEQVLESRLITDARQKAARLATLANRKLGSLILISEVTESEGGSLKTFLQTIMRMDAMGGRMGLSPGPADKIVVEKSLRIRFAFQ